MKLKQYYPPSSKSLCHRALICGAKSQEFSIIRNLNLCDDVLASIDLLSTLGAHIELDKENNLAKIRKGHFPKQTKGELFCKESASTLRLMIAQVLNLNETCLFNGSQSLAKRPLDSFFQFFDAYHVEYKTLNPSKELSLPLEIKGNLKGGTYRISAEKSSQFASGLMLFLGGLNSNSKINLGGKIESFDYIRLTEETMKSFGIEIRVKENLVQIAPSQYKARNFVIEADYSQASYFIALGLLHKGIIIKNLNKNSLQADRRIVEFVQKMGGKLDFSTEDLIVSPSKLSPCEIDVSQCPDLAPTLASLLSVAGGRSIIKGGKRLIYKESDRLHRTAEELNKLGARIQVLGDSMIIDGVKELRGCKVSSHGDHRLAMSLSILKPVTKGNIHIDDVNCVRKSYPNFFKDLGDYYE